MTFDEAVAKGSPRVFRNLKIDEVSSVTSGAGAAFASFWPSITRSTRRPPWQLYAVQNAATRHRRKFTKGAANAAPATRSSRRPCPCPTSRSRITRSKDKPTLSFQKAITKALDTPQFSQLHRDEKMARHSAGG